MPMTAADRRRLRAQSGKREPIPRHEHEYAKKRVLEAIDEMIREDWKSLDDNERDCLKLQRDRVAKFLGRE